MKAMPLTACRNSIWFGNYDCLKMAIFASRTNSSSPPSSWPDANFGTSYLRNHWADWHNFLHVASLQHSPGRFLRNFWNFQFWPIFWVFQKTHSFYLNVILGTSYLVTIGPIAINFGMQLHYKVLQEFFQGIFEILNFGLVLHFLKILVFWHSVQS